MDISSKSFIDHKVSPGVSDAIELKGRANDPATPLYSDSSKGSWIGSRLIRAVFRSDEQRQAYRIGIQNYLSHLEETCPDAAKFAASQLEDRIANGSPLTMRKVREIESQFAENLLTQVDVSVSNLESANTLSEKGVEEAKSLFEKVEITLSRMGTSDSESLIELSKMKFRLNDLLSETRTKESNSELAGHISDFRKTCLASESEIVTQLTAIAAVVRNNAREGELLKKSLLSFDVNQGVMHASAQKLDLARSAVQTQLNETHEMAVTGGRHSIELLTSESVNSLLAEIKTCLNDKSNGANRLLELLTPKNRALIQSILSSIDRFVIQNTAGCVIAHLAKCFEKRVADLEKQAEQQIVNHPDSEASSKSKPLEKDTSFLQNAPGEDDQVGYRLELLKSLAKDVDLKSAFDSMDSLSLLESFKRNDSSDAAMILRGIFGPESSSSHGRASLQFSLGAALIELDG